MKIYDWFDGPYPARVRIAVVEKQLQSQVSFQSIDLWKGEHKKPEFLAINYSGTLPVLELPDGTRIAECTAITEYLDNLDEAPTLTGRAGLEKSIIHMMNKRAEIEFLDAVSVYFHHSTPGLGPDVELYQNPEWGDRMRDKAIRGMQYFDRVLQERPYVAGDSFSMADIAVIGGLVFADIVKLEVPDNLKALHGWHDKVRERPSVQHWKTMSNPQATAA
jgi:glutathione S-transferase